MKLRGSRVLLAASRRSMKLVAFALALLASLPAFADAQDDVRARLESGLGRYQEQDYRAAIETLSRVVQDPLATRDQRARAYEYLGMAQLIVGKKQRARESFEELFAIDPRYTLSDPSHSPKLREFFESVRGSYVPGYGRARGEAELEHAAPTGATAGRPIEVEANVIRGALVVRDVVVEWRRQGLLSYAEERMRGDGGRWHLKFAPPRETNDYALEYFLEARDAEGRVVARVASPESPLRVPVHGAPLPPAAWYKRWYVWAAVGAVVAGAAIGGAVAGTAEHAPAGSLPPGRVTLTLPFNLR